MNEGPLHHLFSKQQRAFFAEHAPDGLGLEHLAVLGPVTCSSSSTSRRDMGASSWRSCGSIPTAPESSSFPPSASRPRPSTWLYGPRLSERAWRQPLRGAADEDPDGARVLQRTTVRIVPGGPSAAAGLAVSPDSESVATTISRRFQNGSRSRSTGRRKERKDMATDLFN